MLHKNYRLSSRNAVRRSSRYGKQAKYAEFSVRYIDNKFEKARLAVVVGKKVSKSAVKRNRIKRQITEAYRQNILEKITEPLDIVVFVHNKKASDKPPKQLTLDLLKLFKKANIL